MDQDFDFLHVPNLWCTLILVSCLVSERISFIPSSKGGILSANDSQGPPLAHVHPCNSLYLLNATYTTGNTAASAMLVRSSSPALSLHTWHQRLGHASFLTVLKASEHADGISINPASLLTATDGADSIHCALCLMGKHKRSPFSTVVRHASAPAELVHSNIWGPVNITSSSGDSYFVVFTDNYTRYSLVYLMRTKSDVFKLFKKFVPWMETQSRGHIKCLHSDNGEEYVL